MSLKENQCNVKVKEQSYTSMFYNYLWWLPDLTYSSAINRAQLISAIASESMISRAELHSIFQCLSMCVT